MENIEHMEISGSYGTKIDTSLSSSFFFFMSIPSRLVNSSL